MATNRIQTGNVVRWINATGSDVSSGAPVAVGNLTGVAITDIANGASGGVAMGDVWELPKVVGQAISAWDDLYFNAATGKVQSGYTGVYAGKAILAATAAATVVQVLLGAASPSVLDGSGGDQTVFFDDFLGAAAAAPWTTVDVGDATEALEAAAHGGEYSIALAATSEAEDAVLYFGDNLQFDIDKALIFECRLKMAVVPGTGVAAVFGMSGSHDLDKDTVAQHAWFRLQATADLLVESDDGSNDNNDKDCSALLVAGEYHTFLIDMRDTSDVRFYVDGVRVQAATTFDMSNYTGQLQPYLSLDKASGTGLGTLTVDWVRITADR